MAESIRPAAGTPSHSNLDTQKRRLKESCQQFEAVLTGYLFKSMRESVMRSETPDQTREMYEGMIDQSVAKALSEQRGLGLGDTLYKSLLPLLKENTRAPQSVLEAPFQVPSPEEATAREGKSLAKASPNSLNQDEQIKPGIHPAGMVIDQI